MITLDMMREALSDDKTVRFNEETVGGETFVIVSYMISNDDLWHKRFGLETRGITFNAKTGQIVSRPFEKFFNVGEKAWTQPHDVANQMRWAYVTEKRDGSMITPVVVNDRVFLKTKKSFCSDVALSAQANMTKEVEELCRDLARGNYTPIFEYTCPDNKVVIDYGSEPEFVLLAVRDNVSGNYWDYDVVREAGKAAGVRVIETYQVTFDEMQEMVETAEGIEGWVIYTPDHRYKIKTKWYCDRHRVLDVRERDIARFAIEESLDDMLPEMSAGGCDMARIEAIARQVAHEVGAIQRSIEDFVYSAKQYEGMDQINYVKEHAGALQKFVFRALRGQDNSEESIKAFWVSRFLPEYSLRSVGNPNFGGRDDEE